MEEREGEREEGEKQRNHKAQIDVREETRGIKRENDVST